MINRDVEVLRQAIRTITQILAESDIKVTQQGLDAYTRCNSRTGKIEQINLPYLPDDASEELIGAVQGYLDHEVGHALFSDFSAIRSVNGDLTKEIHNMIEDAFVERKMVQKFRGSSYNLSNVGAYYRSKFLDKVIAEGNSDDIKRALIVPAIRALCGQEAFSNYMQDKWHLLDDVKDKIGHLSSRLSTTEATRQNVELAQEIVKILFEPPKQPPKQQPKQPSKPNGEKQGPQEQPNQEESESESENEEDTSESAPEEESMVSDDDSAESGDDEDKGDAESTESESADDGADENEPQSDDEESDESSPENGGGEGDDASSDEGESDDEGEDSAENDDMADGGSPSRGTDDGSDTEAEEDETAEGEDGDDESEENEGEGALSETIRSLQEGKIDSGYSNSLATEVFNVAKTSDYQIFTDEFDKIGLYEEIDFGRLATDEEMKEFEEKTAHMVSPIQKDIERSISAKSQSTQVGGFRSGKLHAASLTRLMMNDDRIFRRKQINKTKDVAVSLVIDCSGSMGGDRINLAASAAYTLSSVLDRLGIKHEVIGFTTTGMPYETSVKMSDDYHNLGMRYARSHAIVMPIFKSYGERMSPLVKKRLAATALSYGRMGANCDGESVMIAAKRLMAQKEAGKVMIVLSDGLPACGGYADFDKHLKDTVAQIEAAKVNVVGIGIDSRAVEGFYKQSIFVDDVKELPSVVARQLKGMLLAGAK